MRRPVDQPFSITTEFGEYMGNLARFGKHSGVDYGVQSGSKVLAPADARVSYSGYDNTGGNMVILYDGKYYHRLMHNSRLHVPLGAQVKEGQHIADSGSTGLSSGPHVHWDIGTKYKAESFADFIPPADWIAGKYPIAAPVVAPVKAKLEEYQRLVGGFGVNRRTAPSLASSVLEEFPANDTLDFKGYVKGEEYAGVDIWFVGRYSDTYFWAGAFTDPQPGTLPNITPTVALAQPAPTPAAPTPPPADLTGKVIDISSHNKVVDYAAVKSAVRAVIAKAGHTGKSYGGTAMNGDPTFDVHKQNFGDKLVGAYWYAYCSLDPRTEARAFTATVGKVPVNFTYWLDIEEADGMTDSQINDWCQTFFNEVEHVIGRKCGIYTYRNFYGKLTQETLGGRPLWLAHYDVDEWHNPVENQVAHQYTSEGSVPGMSGNIDLNVVRESFFIPSPQTPPEPSTPNAPVVGPIEPDKDEPAVVSPTPDPTTPDVVVELKTVILNVFVTFFQAFGGAWAATGFNLDRVVLAGAVGAALSLVWNTILKPFLIKQGAIKQ